MGHGCHERLAIGYLSPGYYPVNAILLFVEIIIAHLMHNERQDDDGSRHSHRQAYNIKNRMPGMFINVS